jgi:nucleotide-binding universal stress UspA family protein
MEAEDEAMLKSALVAVDGSPCGDSAVTLALNWSGRFGARLLGLGVVDEYCAHPREAVPVGAGVYKKARDAARLADGFDRVASVLAGFRARAAEAGVLVEMLEEVGEPAARIIGEAQRVDVVFLGRETHFDFTAPERQDATLAHVVRSSSRPIVVVPPTPAEGAGVLVAYGGGREAARTLQTFVLLGLADGDTLDVITVNRDAGEARATARAATDFLRVHAIMHRVHTIASSAPPADVLLEEIASRRPRLLVLGAHRDHPLRDLFATSVTREVLAACPVPMFVGA